MITEAEARFRSEQASHVSNGGHEQAQARDSWDSTTTWCRSKRQASCSDTEKCPQGTALNEARTKSADSAILAELGNRRTSMKENLILAKLNPNLEALQEDVYVLISVILMQMATFRSLEKRQISELALFFIFEGKYGILMEFNDQIEDLYQPLNGMGEGLGQGLLQLRFDALPLQLQAVFKMDCHERERQGGEIDDRERMALVLDNQRRTEILRDIQDAIYRKREISNEIRSE